MVAFLPSHGESLSENKAREEQSQEMEGVGVRGGEEGWRKLSHRKSSRIPLSLKLKPDSWLFNHTNQYIPLFNDSTLP